MASPWRTRRRTPGCRAAVVIGVALFAAACARSGSGPRRVMAEEAVLARQIDGLRQLVTAAETGSLLPTDALVVAVDEKLVTELAQLALPRERVIAGKYRVRLDQADVRFRDKWGSVRLDGRVSPADRPAEDVFAELAVFGHMDAVDLDPQSGVLQARVSVIGFEVKKVGVFGESEAGRRLLESLAQQQVESLGELAFPVRFPVRLEQDIALGGATEGPVRLVPARFPLKVTVADVSAHGERLWVALKLETGPWTKLAEGPDHGPGMPTGAR